MKWITPLWSDPVGWSEWVAKTKTRVFIWTLIHICFVSAGLFMIYWSFQVFHEFPEIPSLRVLAILSGAAPIVFIGVGYPAMYLYAMHRMLLMLKAQNRPNEDRKDQADG